MNTRQRWEKWTALPLLVLSVLFIVAWTIVVIDESLSPQVANALRLTLAVVWLSFLADYLVRLITSSHRGSFVRKNLPDLLSVIFPVFRPFRLMTLLKELPYFRARTASSTRVQFVAYALIFVLLFVYSISLAVLQAERSSPDANITNFGDALWWACVTIATVGYGDLYPVTIMGRLLSVLLMVGGIAIVGVASATVISILNERLAHAKHDRAEQEASAPEEPEPLKPRDTLES